MEGRDKEKQTNKIKTAIPLLKSLNIQGNLPKSHCPGKKTGKSIIVTKRGEPYALVTRPPAPEKTESWLGKYKREIEITGDIIKPAVDESDWEILK